MPVRLPAALLAAALVVPAALTFPAMAQPAADSPAASAPAAAPDDPYLWLEDVLGERSLAWVRERNAHSREVLEAWPRFHATRDEVRQILDSKDRIPTVTRRGDWLYNFWQDDQHPRGLWRRTTLAEYRKPQPHWDVLLDIDALGQAEKRSWVWHGADCLGPDYRHCLLTLSPGGSDAAVVREFDAQTRHFVDGGFALPEAKSDVTWADADTIYVGTDFGAGSLTDSGYPRVIKRWKRGQPLAEAVTVFEGRPQDVSVSASVDHTPGYERTVFSRALDFYNTESFLLKPDGQLQHIDKPSDAQLSFWRDQLLLELRSDWTVGAATYPRGSLLAAPATAYLKGERTGLVALFTPTPTRSLAGTTTTRSHLLLNVLDNVTSRLEEWHHADGRWQPRSVQAPALGTLSVTSLEDPQVRHDPLAEAYLLGHTGFLTPDSLALAHAGDDKREPLKSRPAFFDAAGMHVEQAFATSKDGTKVPYFVVWPKGATPDGANPTLLYGYGGFEISLVPWYSAVVGKEWLAHGGVYVVANLRGGGEYGPAWHQGAVKANKQHSFDDFAAVAEDLIRRRITSARHLGIQGGSNGGLLVGATFVERPELFNAVVCQVPLLDMRRFNKLLAGASWMAEYGNPDDPADWAYISKYSPYQNVKADVTYPKVFFTTSTRDDRVHPAHARKMAARMLAQGHDLLYYENIEGGHGGAADNAQRADVLALEYSYLWQQLGR
jgi:prolyl oligopeptidase